MSTANGKKYFAHEFVVDGGTSSDFLMGDGTLSSVVPNETIGTDTDLTTSGATVVDEINLTDGVVTAHSTRTLTLANLGYTGATDANNYVLPFTDNSTNWNTAFGWGDHDGLYLPIAGKAADSDKLDAMDSTRFPYALTGTLGTTNTFTTDGGIGSDAITRSMFFRDNNGDFGAIGFHASHATSSNYAWQMATTSYSNAGSIQARSKNNGTWTSPVDIWNSGNDGAGSGLDADKLDAQEGTYYLDYSNFTNTPTIPSAYTHPTHPGDDMSIDTGVLTGAVVVSDIDLNVTTDTLGHVTDANATVATRTLTLANLGYTGATDANNTTARTDEEIRDVAAAQWINGTNTTVVVDDAANTIKINASGGSGTVSIDATASTILAASGTTIGGKDATSDKLVFWDDSEGLLNYLTVGSGLSLSGTTLTATGSGGSQNLFETIAVSGQSSIVADSTTDTLNFAAGSGISLTTNALTDTLTITATGGGGGTVDGSGTTKYIPKWTASDTIGDSSMVEDSAGEISIVDTDSGSGAGPIINLDRQSSSAAANDLIGVINFKGKASSTEVIYGKIQQEIKSVGGGGGIDGAMVFSNVNNGSLQDHLEFRSGTSYMSGAWSHDSNYTNSSSINVTGTLKMDNSAGTNDMALFSTGSLTTPVWKYAVESNTTDAGSNTIRMENMVRMTQSNYDALSTYQSNCLYVIVG